MAGDAGTAPAVSVVIPAYNEEARIARCLESVLRQRTTVRFEVVVVDSSSDSTAAVVRERFPEVRLIRRARQTLAAQARNIGVEASRGGIVAFIDADCRAAPDWIERIVAAHATGHLAIGGAVTLDTPATVCGAALFAVEFSEYGAGSPRREIRWLPSCNLSVKREALEGYGGFPTGMETSEDIVFTRRLAAESGVALLFDPAIRIAHTNRDDFRGFCGKLAKLGLGSGRSRATGIVPGGMLVRHPFAVPLLVPYRLALTCLRSVFRSRDSRLVLVALVLWPLLLVGLGCWARGFRLGAGTAAGMRPERT